MKNNRFQKMYKRILNIIKNTEEDCEIIIENNKFSFVNYYNSAQDTTIILDNEEFNNMNIGIYNEKTKYLKVLDYLYKIKNDIEITPFNTAQEKEIYLYTIKIYKRISFLKYLAGVIKDIIISIISVISAWEDYGTYTGLQLGALSLGLGIGLPMYIFGFKFVGKLSLIAAISPTVVYSIGKYLTLRICRLQKHLEKLAIADNIYENVNYLSKNMLLEDNNYPVLEQSNNKTSQLQQSSLTDPVYNEISNILNILSQSNLNQNVISIILNKIKEIKEEYITRINEVDKLTYSLENRYTIQNEIIRKLSIIEYELKKEIEKNLNECTQNKESDIIDRKIFHLENRNKYKTGDKNAK